MRKRALIPTIALLTTAGVTLAGCSDDSQENQTFQSPEAVQPGPSTTPSPASTSPSEEATSDDVTAPAPTSSSTPAADDNGDTSAQSVDLRSSKRLDWHGGMLAHVTKKTDDVEVTGWTPGMEAPATCALEPWREDEIKDGLPITRGFAIAAPTEDPGENVTVLVAATPKASGVSNSRETRVYAQNLDLSSCELGERVQVDDPVSQDGSSVEPEIIASGRTTLALRIPGPDGSTDERLVGFEPGAGETTWTSPHDVSSDRRDVTGAVVPVELHGPDRAVMSAETGEVIADGRGLEGPTGTFGESVLVTFLRSFGEAAQEVHGPDGMRPVTGGAITGGFAMQDGDGEFIHVGYLCGPEVDYCSAREGGIGYIDSGGELHSVLSAEEVDELGLKLVGGSAGVIYANTTDEGVAFDLSGEDVEQPVEGALEEAPQSGDRVVDGRSWALWTQSDGDSLRIAPVGERES